MKNNFVNIDNPDLYIYRVFKANRLIEMFKTKKLVVVKPELWDDPFENFLIKSSTPLPSGGIMSFRGVADCFYGQCWTLNQESDAMWRIYSPDKNGAKVKTTIRRLHKAIYNPNNEFESLSYYIGKVMHMTEEEIRKMFADPDFVTPTVLDHSGLGQVPTLLLKREAFVHEKEVRLVYRETTERYKKDQNIIEFDIDPNTLFDEIVFDPRMSETDYEMYSNEIKRCSFTKPISQSTLCQAPNLKINIYPQSSVY